MPLVGGSHGTEPAPFAVSPRGVAAGNEDYEVPMVPLDSVLRGNAPAPSFHLTWVDETKISRSRQAMPSHTQVGAGERAPPLSLTAKLQPTLEQSCSQCIRWSSRVKSMKSMIAGSSLKIVLDPCLMVRMFSAS